MAMQPLPSSKKYESASYGGEGRLPSEILTQIFLLVDHVTLRDYLPRVCKQWTTVVVNMPEFKKHVLNFKKQKVALEHGQSLLIHIGKTEGLSELKVLKYAPVIDFIDKCTNRWKATIIESYHNLVLLDNRPLPLECPFPYFFPKNREGIEHIFKVGAYNAHYLFCFKYDGTGIYVTDFNNTERFSLDWDKRLNITSDSVFSNAWMQCEGDFLFVGIDNTVCQWNYHARKQVGMIQSDQKGLDCHIVDKRVVRKINRTTIEILPFCNANKARIEIKSDLLKDRKVKVIKIDGDFIYLKSAKDGNFAAIARYADVLLYQISTDALKEIFKDKERPDDGEPIDIVFGSKGQIYTIHENTIRAYWIWIDKPYINIGGSPGLLDYDENGSLTHYPYEQGDNYFAHGSQLLIYKEPDYALLNTSENTIQGVMHIWNSIECGFQSSNWTSIHSHWYDNGLPSDVVCMLDIEVRRQRSQEIEERSWSGWFWATVEKAKEITAEGCTIS